MKTGTILIICMVFLLAIIVPQELFADAAPAGPALAIFIGALVVGAVLLGLGVYHIFNAPARGLSELEFQEEEVVLDLDEECSQVSCTFFIVNNSTEPYTGMFYFPFVVDETHPFPSNIQVRYAVNGEATAPEVVHRSDRVFFELTLAAEARTVLYVKYAQCNLEPKVTYVITSANDWHQPVGKAVFRIRHPAAWQDVEISHDPETSVEQNSEIVHTIFIENLAPERELEISWTPEK